jgi:hypothetical protein
MINTKHAHMYIYINHTTGMRLTMLLNIHMQKSTSYLLSQYIQIMHNLESTVLSLGVQSSFLILVLS